MESVTQVIQQVIQIEELSHAYGGREALSHVSFEVGPGQIFGCLGPNGSGKSTLFQILSTLLTPSLVQNIKILGLDAKTQRHMIRKKIGVLFQKPSVDKKLTVFENLMFHGYLYGKSKAWLIKKIDELLVDLGLSDRKNEYVETLSGGYQRRVEIAKALLSEPRLLLMDEPSTGIDPVARVEFWKILEFLRNKQVNILLTTHFIEEADTCDMLMILDQGRRVALDTPANLKKEVRGDVVTIQSKNLNQLKEKLESRSLKTWVIENTLHVEMQDALPGIVEIVKSFPTEVESVTLSKPTLYDVFVHKTGRAFRSESS